MINYRYRITGFAWYLIIFKFISLNYKIVDKVANPSKLSLAHPNSIRSSQAQPSSPQPGPF